MTIAEKVAYLKGMLDGMELENSKEAKLLGAVVDVLADISTALETVDDRLEGVGEEIDALSDDLADVEEMVYDEDDECDDDCCCEDDDFFEVDCPNCGEPLCIDEDVLEEGLIQCPNCEQKFVLDLSDEDDDECGCDCCCEDDDDPDDEGDLSF